MEKSFILVFSLSLTTYVLENAILGFSLNQMLQAWVAKGSPQWTGEKATKISANHWVKNSINWDTYEFWSRPYLIGTLTNESKNPKYWWFSFLFWPISIQEGGKLRKKKILFSFLRACSPSLSPLCTQNIYILISFPLCSVTKRDVMKALCEWGCHGRSCSR